MLTIFYIPFMCSYVFDITVLTYTELKLNRKKHTHTQSHTYLHALHTQTHKHTATRHVKIVTSEHFCSSTEGGIRSHRAKKLSAKKIEDINVIKTNHS